MAQERCFPASYAAALSLVASISCSSASRGETDQAALRIEDAIVLSSLGGRPAFSPDGKRVAFVAKSYGDAFEIDLATRTIHNLTKDVPHGGVVRIQYLANGDYLITAPRAYNGPNTRAHLEMWVLDKSLRRGLQPLGSQVFEGIAVSRRRNLIAWTVIEPELKPNESWMMAYTKKPRYYVAEVAYRGGVPQLIGKRQILNTLPKECSFIEPQDFADADRELIYSCVGQPGRGPVSISVMGTHLADGSYTTYYRREGTYAEVEGIAPSGRWTSVECGRQEGRALPPLDICKLELRPGAELSTLVRGTAPRSDQGISNPVISPNGQWIAFQRSDSNETDVGAGVGVYLLRLPPSTR